MVLGGEHHVLLAGATSQVHEVVRIEFRGIESSPQLAIFGFGDAVRLGSHDRMLVRYFVQKLARRMQKHIETIPAAAMKTLTNWEWPGNIRELENFIERSVILTHGAALQAPIAELSYNGRNAPVAGTYEANDRDEIVRILRVTSGRVGGADGAAARMGIKRTTLISRMKKLGIDRAKYRDPLSSRLS
jgi:DNA-binding NtrC family response regulator